MGKYMKAASFSLAGAKYTAGDNLKFVSDPFFLFFVPSSLPR
jgi:hypothetical protein